MSSNVCTSSSKAPPSNTLNVWSELSTLSGSLTWAYPFPLLILPIKLPKRLVGARSLLSLHFISVSIACGVLPSAKPVVSFITSRITRTVSATGLLGEYE